MGCSALSAACRTAGVCSTSYSSWEQQRAAGWRSQRRPGRRRQPAAAVAAAAAGAGTAAMPLLPCRWTLPDPSSSSSSSGGSSILPSAAVPCSRRRSTVCRVFGDNLRRGGRRGDKSVGEQSRDDPNGSSAAGPDQTSVWSDWQGERAGIRSRSSAAGIARAMQGSCRTSRTRTGCCGLQGCPCCLLPLLPNSLHASLWSHACSRVHEPGLGGLGGHQCGRPG